jgi:hypothetical protein
MYPRESKNKIMPDCEMRKKKNWAKIIPGFAFSV